MSQKPPPENSPTDLELVERLQQAKTSPTEDATRCAHESFQLLFERHHRALLAFALTRVARRSIAEELVQSCWLKAWTHLGTHFHGGHFRGWMFELLRNRIVDESRKRKEQAVSLQDFDQDIKNPSEAIVQLREDRLEALRDCLAELEEPRGEIVRYRLQGMEYQEIATTLEIPPNTAMTMFHRAKQSLKLCIEGRLV